MSNPTVDTPLPLNQVIAGDCVEVLARLPAGCADLVFADPPTALDTIPRPNRTLVDGVHAEWDKFSSLAEYDKFTGAWLSASGRS